MGVGPVVHSIRSLTALMELRVLYAWRKSIMEAAPRHAARDSDCADAAEASLPYHCEPLHVRQTRREGSREAS